MPKNALSTEQVKMVFDHTKHLTTLSTGSILMIIAFYKELSSNHVWTYMVGVGLVAFIFSILASTIAQVVTIKLPSTQKTDALTEKKDNMAALPFIISWATFLIGIIFLCVYGVKNLCF